MLSSATTALFLDSSGLLLLLLTCMETIPTQNSVFKNYAGWLLVVVYLAKRNSVGVLRVVHHAATYSPPRPLAGKTNERTRLDVTDRPRDA